MLKTLLPAKRAAPSVATPTFSSAARCRLFDRTAHGAASAAATALAGATRAQRRRRLAQPALAASTTATDTRTPQGFSFLPFTVSSGGAAASATTTTTTTRHAGKRRRNDHDHQDDTPFADGGDAGNKRQRNAILASSSRRHRAAHYDDGEKDAAATTANSGAQGTKHARDEDVYSDDDSAAATGTPANGEPPLRRHCPFRAHPHLRKRTVDALWETPSAEGDGTVPGADPNHDDAACTRPDLDVPAKIRRKVARATAPGTHADAALFCADDVKTIVALSLRAYERSLRAVYDRVLCERLDEQRQAYWQYVDQTLKRPAWAARACPRDEAGVATGDDASSSSDDGEVPWSYIS